MSSSLLQLLAGPAGGQPQLPPGPQTIGVALASGGAPATGGNATATSGQTPSTAGFLQVLDMLLSSAPLTQTGSTSVSGLLVQTSVTSTSSDASKPTFQEQDPTSPAPLDPTLCANIASLLQALGFQVRPEDVAQLSPMDQRQLDSALEFATRNLQKGMDPSQVAECTALLLPRPWPLDDRDGTPTSAATSVGGQKTAKLPDGYLQLLASTQAQLHAAVDPPAASVPGGGQKPVQAALALQVETTPAAAQQPSPKTSVPVAAQTSVAAAAVAAPTVPQPAAPTAKASSTDPALQVLQGLQQDPGPDNSQNMGVQVPAKQLTPGGPASEFIGRQVLEKVQIQLSSGSRELSLRLWPEELGEVRLSLRMTDTDKVHAHIVVDNDQVRQAMLDSMPQLRDALIKHGMDLEKMSVSVGQKDAGSANSGTDGGEDGNGDGTRRNGRGGRTGDEEVLVALPLALGVDTGRRDGLNTFDLWS